jgi:hypothetical protein
VGPFKHRDPEDRPDAVFSGRVTIHFGGETDSHLLVPVIPKPPKDQAMFHLRPCRRSGRDR